MVFLVILAYEPWQQGGAGGERFAGAGAAWGSGVMERAEWSTGVME
jgi:hypothetical protein